MTLDATLSARPTQPATPPSPAAGRKIAVTVAKGDGIGPEIMDATLRVLDAAGAPLAYEFIDIGERVYAQGHSSGIAPESWESLRRTRVFLKAPITTPQGGGFKSLNVTTRKTLGLYANVRPCVAYNPFVRCKHPGMNVVIVRENEEDTYAGIEHRQTSEVTQCLKLISRPGCEKIVRYAFEYARAFGRKKVTCFTKDNIMKATDGLFHKVFDEIGAEYPDLEKEHWIVDIGAAKLADTPAAFDVIVMPNLYGDILSDVGAQIAGSVGLAGSANIGEHGAMFEAIHGSAPRRAGLDMANPSGLMLGAVQMLVHLGLLEAAERFHNAWLRTIEDGIHTYDIFDPAVSRQKVGTRAFADAVIARIGQRPVTLAPASYAHRPVATAAIERKPVAKPVKRLVGVDVFLDWDKPGRNPAELAAQLKSATSGLTLALKMVTNRGVKVWPEGFPETFCTDHWRCRFLNATPGAAIAHADVIKVLEAVARHGLDFIKTEHLCEFDGEAGYSKGQGE
ncbi:MAG: NADP-dependent isocitrate dehydrogenase [Phycisphaerae bacterium]|jgi:isocitrate dehydrogenase